MTPRKCALKTCGRDAHQWTMCDTCADTTGVHVPHEQTPEQQAGHGPWVWEVNERYLVTTRNLWPKNGGITEQIRCGIIGNFPNHHTAQAWATTYTERLHQLRTV